ncbi:MAG: D-alanyl-D-alanine carboxypeptidase/D-alanyl-D-alanine-endopeptidase [Propionibacteriaceae bacterium]|nr:D-alanyl-D-alanine carboxypeptidase/D-alanyl-D-alanine-endopeptidase [Propionibacteriaceae bacterium]
MSTSRLARQWLMTWIVLGLVLATAVAGAVFFRPLMRAVGAEVTGAPTTVPPSLLMPTAVPGVTPTSDGGAVGPAAAAAPGDLPDRAALEAQLNGLDIVALAAGAEALQLAYEVVDTDTSEVVAARDASTLLIPASNTKLLTTTAVMHALDRQTRFPTRVLKPAAGSIVLVGGGDPLLTTLPTGTYPHQASLQELATLTATALKDAGESSVSLAFDASFFTDAGWNETWPSNYRDQVTQISALWVDEGKQPGVGRSRTPALAAATAFAAQLTTAGITVTGAPTPAVGSGAEVARVESEPLHVLAEQMMLRSNNSFAEVLGFQLAAATGHPTTFAGSVAAIEEQLRELSLWTEGAVLRDASGLSRSNLVSAAMLSLAMGRAVDDPNLSVILDGLPVAGVTGTLASRFADDISLPARGVARAKTGTLSRVSSLAGTTTTADGRSVSFAFLTNGSADGWAAKVWADQSVGVVTACGC